MKSSSWALCAAAVLAGDMGLQLLTTQPMAERVESLSAQVSQLQTGIDQLTASAGNATPTNDLLSSLTIQGQRMQGAREAIEQIRRFEREVRSQGHAVGHSMGLVQNIGRLHKEIITQGQQINDLNGAIDELSAFQQQVHGLTSAASREYVDVDRATQLVRELGQLKQNVAAQAKGIDGAIASLEQLAALKQRAMAEAEGINGAFGGLDLLASLKQRAMAEAEGIDGAFGGLDQLASLKQRAMAEADGINGAFGGLDQLAALKQRAARGADGIDDANNSLRQLGELKERVATEADGLDIAENQFARLIGLKKSLELIDEQELAAAASNIIGFNNLRDLIIEGGQDIGAAIDFSRQLLAMQDELVDRGSRVDVARKHADGLLSLEDALADDAHLNISLAQNNLNGLVAIERQLNAQDQQIVAAVETLELMSDLQAEFVRRIGDLQGLRSGLTELAMLESSIVRTVRSLQPLVELTSLRRLSGEDLQVIARGMLERRTSRIAVGDPNDLPLRDDFRAIDRNRTDESGELLVPIPPTRQ